MAYNPFTDNSLSQDAKAALMRNKYASGDPLGWDRQQAQNAYWARQPGSAQAMKDWRDAMIYSKANETNSIADLNRLGQIPYLQQTGQAALTNAQLQGLAANTAAQGTRAQGEGLGSYYGALGSTRVPAEAGLLGAQAGLIKNFNLNDMLSNIGEWFKNMPQFNFGGGFRPPAATAGNIAANQAQQLRPWEIV